MTRSVRRSNSAEHFFPTKNFLGTTVRERLQRAQHYASKQDEALALTAAVAAEVEERAFVAEWEQQTEARHGRIENGSEADAWRRWALHAIDRLDRLCN